MESQDQAIQNLISLSRHYGNNPEYVIAEGGNTSWKNETHIWIKASGTPLSAVDDKSLVCLSRDKLGLISEKRYSKDYLIREEEVRQDLCHAVVNPGHRRPSVETSLHNTLDLSYIVHTHPTFVNGLTCSLQAEQNIREIFGEDVLYIQYADPGYALFKKVSDLLGNFRRERGFIPAVIFLQNHGVFVGAGSSDEVMEIYTTIESKIKARIRHNIRDFALDEFTSDRVTFIRNHFSGSGFAVKAYTGELIRHFTADMSSFSGISSPFTPDNFMYCRPHYLFIPDNADAGDIGHSINAFRKKHGYPPRIILLQGGGMIVIGESAESCQTARDIYFSLMKISLFAESFGGPRPLTRKQIDFIDRLEAEYYKKNLSARS